MAATPFQQRLGTQLNHYDCRGKRFLEAVVDLIYEHHLPAGLEYLDRDAIETHVDVSLQNASLQEVLTAVVAKLPGYRLTFGSGLVNLNSPKARADASNLLNVTIPSFAVEGTDAMEASVRALGALSATLHPDWGYGASFAPLGGPKKVTIRLQRATVHEILDAIVSQQGDALWVVRVPPDRLATFHGGLWQLYSLDPNWKHVVIEDAEAMFCSPKKGR